MDVLITLVGWTVGAVVALFVAWQIFIAVYVGTLERSHGAAVDFSTLELTWKPNQFLMAPAGATRAQAHAVSDVLPQPPAQVAAALMEVVKAQPSTRILQTSPDGLSFTAVQQTRLMRYPDFAAIEVRAAEGGSVVLAYSRAVFGIRDFGVNRARVEGWMRELRGRLG